MVVQYINFVMFFLWLSILNIELFITLFHATVRLEFYQKMKQGTFT